MYERPTYHAGRAAFHYTTHQDVTVAALAHAHEKALEDLKARADKNDDLLDPNSLRVEVIVTGRAL